VLDLLRHGTREAHFNDYAAKPANDTGKLSELKKLSLLNGKINRMTKEELCIQLSSIHLDNRANKGVLQKRLKNYYKRQKLQRSLIPCSNTSTKTNFDFVMIIDFEATCDHPRLPNFIPEIIEFPAVLLCTHSHRVVSEFHRYCRPVKNPKLSKFCKTLTGITQDQVDTAKIFKNVFAEFEVWLKKFQLGTRYKFAVVTDGPYDMGRFLFTQCELDKIPLPKFGKQWINITKTFSNFYKCKRGNLAHMLEFSGLAFEGRQHCGLHDARNIARIATQLLKDGAVLRINEYLE